MASRSDIAFHGEAIGFVEDLYARFRDDPDSVDEHWRGWFRGLDEAGHGEGNGSPLSLGPSFTPSSIFNPPPLGRDGRIAAPKARVPASPESPVTPESLAEWLPFLMELELFSGVPQEDVEELARDSGEMHLADGDYVFHRGDASEDMFVVLQGGVLIWRDGDVVTEIGVGQVVGELGVLEEAPRIADALARGETRLLRIRGRDLTARMDSRPALARGIIRGLTRRMQGRRSLQDRVDQLIRSYRVRGHLVADLNPLAPPSRRVPELEIEHYGLGEGDLDRLFATTSIPGTRYLTLRSILERMRETYCGSIGVQYMHIDEARKKMWFQERLEDPRYRRPLTREEQLRILTKLIDAEIFEQFIHKKFLGAKRFSLEGAESLIPLLDLAIEQAASEGVKEAVIGMPHRGRLNVLANILGKSPRQIFREFADADAGRYLGRGDVKYHLGYSHDFLTSRGETIHLSLCFNPSHLEFVGPVVLGRVRAKQDRYADHERRTGMGIIIHGDAAFAGEGVVQEMLNMSGLAGYATGGTLHIIVNNQIGFTTPPESGRSTQYATDVARMLQTPIFHVNGEHPEAVAHVIRLAMEYRREFASDVIIDMYCYRRYGHNEGDEPTFTQPVLYEQIRKRKPVHEGYLESLEGQISREESQRIAEDRRKLLEDELGRSRSPDYEPKEAEFGGGVWQPYRGGADDKVPDVPTAVEASRLVELLRAQARLPEGFKPNPKIKNLLESRLEMADGRKPLDWAAGEALAFATLLADGTRVRLTGQDTGRGTFSHRHAVLHDYDDGKTFVPLDNLASDQGRFEVWDSPLSEVAPMGYEFGYSLDQPDSLVLWEAQFGDFCNVAQVIIDQFISSTEDKWHRLSGLGLLLPHGFEGQGPEHSSARLERFLTLCAEDNMQVVNLTTPAQLFHCLRRQILRPLRKPLIVMSPKSLLRHPKAISSLEDLAEGAFRPVLADPLEPQPEKVRRVLLCSGKVYYDLAKEREEREIDDVAILRLEQIYPLKRQRLEEALAIYSEGVSVVWVQEEPRNQGAWPFLALNLPPGPGQEIFERWPFYGIARPASASPATGSAGAHKLEQQKIMEQAFSEA